MFHFTRRRIEAHVCICFVALKVYKELERLLKLFKINMSIDKVLALAQTTVTIQITLPKKQASNQPDNAHETPPTHRSTFLRRFLGVRIDEVRRNGVLYTLRCTMSAIIEWNVAEDWNSRNCNPEGFTSKNTLDKANPSGFAPSEVRMRLAENYKC